TPNASAPPNYGHGPRTDGTPKGLGFFGPLQRPDGRVSTELSVGVTFDDGREVEIPALVPTLTKEEVNALLTKPDDAPPPLAVVRKAVAFAQARMKNGQSPFAAEGEQQLDLYPELARSASQPAAPPIGAAFAPLFARPSVKVK